MRRLFAGIVLTMLAGAGVLLAQTQTTGDAAVGTWTLDLGASKYSPGPAPKSRTVKIDPAGPAVTVTVNGMNGDGSAVSYVYTALFDGKDYIVNGMGKPGDTVALRRQKTNTMEEIYKKDGKVVLTTTDVISEDGKTRTSTQKGTNEQGQQVENMVVYMKQQP